VGARGLSLNFLRHLSLRFPRGRARLAGALALLALAPFRSAAALGAVERRVLENGLTVLVHAEPGSGLVSVGMMYRVGAKNEAAGTTGLAHFVEHMAFRATRRFPGHEITESITRLGGRWSGYTWIDQTWYAATAEKAALDHLLDLERDRMTGALFDPEDFERERSSVLAEWRSYDDPRSLLYDAVLAASFEIHPYRNNTIGWLSDVEGVTRDEAYGFYRRFYQPNNAVLAVAGGVETESVLAGVRERFGLLGGAGAPTAVRTLEPPQAGERRLVLRRSGPHAELLLAFRAPALADPDFPAMVLLDALLAGGKGLFFRRDYPQPPAAPLSRALVGAGLADSARTEWQASLYPYVYALSAVVPDAAGLERAERALQALLASLAEREWTPDERRQALREVRTGLALDLEEPHDRVHQLAFFEVSGGFRHLVEVPERLAAVTSDELRRFARERLRPEQATVGWFVPTDTPHGPPPSTGPSSGAAPDAGSTASASVVGSAPVAPPVTGPAAVATAEGSAAVAPVTRSAPVAAAGRAAETDAAAMPRAVPPPAVTALPAVAAAPSSWSLPNGLRLTVAPLPGASLVALRGRLDAGAVHGPALAPLAAELLATPRPGEDPRAPVLAWGLLDDPAAAANRRYLEFHAACLPEDLPDLLAVLAGRLTAPIPSGAAWERLRSAAARRARSHAARGDTALVAQALESLFPAGSAAAGAPWGEARAIEAAEPGDLRDFLATHVTAAHLRVVVAGAVEAAGLRRMAEAALGGLPKGRASPPPLPVALGPRSWTERRLPDPGSSQDEVRVVWPGDRRRPHDRAATDALLYLLGETGYAGRLGRDLVEPGLVYSVRTSLEEDGAPGFLMVRTACATKDTPEVLRRIRGVLEEAAAGRFTAADLAEAQAYLRGKSARERAGARATAAVLAREGPPASPTLEQLNDTARRLFGNGSPAALVAGPGY